MQNHITHLLYFPFLLISQTILNCSWPKNMMPNLMLHKCTFEYNLEFHANLEELFQDQNLHNRKENLSQFNLLSLEQPSLKPA